MHRAGIELMHLGVAGLHVRIDASEAARGALSGWLGAFLAGPGEVDRGEPDAVLTIDAPFGLAADHRLDDPDAALSLAPRLDPSGLLSLAGSASGWFDPGSGRGALTGARHMGEVDALLRLAVSIVLTARGGVLLHGCAVETGAGSAASRGRGVALLIGHSGAGKSTAAAALGAGLGDELIALRVDETGVFAMGTPWWRGGPGVRPVAAVCVLDRGGAAGREHLVGSRALRAVLPHAVRYRVLPNVDRRVFFVLGAAVARIGVVRLGCPEGSAYLPFLRDALGAIASPAPVEARP